MKFTPKVQPDQLSLLGEHDRVEHRPELVADSRAQRWTTRTQVDLLLAHPRIQAIWPKGDYVAADPCAGTGQLMRHIDDALGDAKPLAWRAWELDGELISRPDTYQAWSRAYSLWYRRVRWAWMDAALLSEQPAVDIVTTNLPWFNVWPRLVGHWRDVAFPLAPIIALCDDQERTRKPSLEWLREGNMPDIIAQLPGRQRFDGADDGDYPWSCSWYVWLPGSRNDESLTIML